MYKGVELLAKATHTHRNRTANELIERGLSSFLGEVIAARIQKIHQQEEIELSWWDMDIIRMIKREARRQGYDISKLI
jgi:hypothetical protein